MNSYLWWLILGVLVLLSVIRRLRSRGERHESPLVALIRRLRGKKRREHSVLGDTGLIAAREIRERLRGRVFWVVTAILFLAIAAVIVVPKLHSSKSSPSDVVLVNPTPAVKGEVVSLAKSLNLSLHVTTEQSLSRATAALRAGKVDLVVDGASSLFVESPIAATDASTSAQFVRSLAVDLGVEKAFESAKLTTAQIEAIVTSKALPVKSLKPHKTVTTAESTALIGVIMIFVVLTQYLSWTLMGVMEETASRVVEVLLATVRPVQLLAGKLAGIGVVALVQAGALALFALVLARAVGSSVLRGAAPVTVLAAFLWLVLGYAFYSWVYAAAGSLAERQDQVQSIALPLGAPMIFGYIVALTGATSGSPSLLVKVLAYLPPTAPFAMTELVGFGQVAWWQFLASVLLSLVATTGIALVAARVYRRAVLRTGRRVRLREVMTASTGR